MQLVETEVAALGRMITFWVRRDESDLQSPPGVCKLPPANPPGPPPRQAPPSFGKWPLRELVVWSPPPCMSCRVTLSHFRVVCAFLGLAGKPERDGAGRSVSAGPRSPVSARARLEPPRDRPVPLPSPSARGPSFASTRPASLPTSAGAECLLDASLDTAAAPCRLLPWPSGWREALDFADFAEEGSAALLGCGREGLREPGLRGPNLQRVGEGLRSSRDHDCFGCPPFLS